MSKSIDKSKDIKKDDKDVKKDDKSEKKDNQDLKKEKLSISKEKSPKKDKAQDTSSNTYTPAFIFNDPHIPKKETKGITLNPKEKNPLQTETHQEKHGKYYSKSLNALRQKIKEQEDEGIAHLFTEDDKKSLEKVLTKEEIETYEGRYEASQRSKLVTDRKMKIDKKVIIKQIHELDEQLKYITLNLREAEQKSKIYQFQINDYKNDISAQENKLYELNMTMDVVNQLLREKEQENKILLLQIHNLKKITKNNSLIPIDSKKLQNLKKSYEDKKGKGELDDEDDEKKNKKKNEEIDDEEDDDDDEGNISDDQNYKIKAQKNKGIDS